MIEVCLKIPRAREQTVQSNRLTVVRAKVSIISFSLTHESIIIMHGSFHIFVEMSSNPGDGHVRARPYCTGSAHYHLSWIAISVIDSLEEYPDKSERVHT